MHIIVTAGGTREAIDEVRYITNASTGATGVEIAKAAASRGHEVTLLLSYAASVAAPKDTKIKLVRFNNVEDLSGALKELSTPLPVAVVHAAAVSDYRVKSVTSRGVELHEKKLSSALDELTLHLVKTPKIIARLKGYFPNAILVGFKLTSGCSEEEISLRAMSLLCDNHLNLVVANDTNGMGAMRHEARLFSPDGVRTHWHTTSALATGLVAAIEGNSFLEGV